MDEINNWINSMKKILNSHNKGEYQMNVVPAISCVDGFSVSIQASPGHYCSPRNEEHQFEFNFDDSNIVHTSFELGFPTESDDLILEYAETPEEPTSTVYGNVPLKKVQQLVSKHGGIDYKKTLEKIATK